MKKSHAPAWPIAHSRVSIGAMARFGGTIVNALGGVCAWALGGPLWGGIVFLAIALVRMALEVNSLRLQNEELRYLLSREGELDEAEGPHLEGAPQSEMRLKPAVASARASQSGA